MKLNKASDKKIVYLSPSLLHLKKKICNVSCVSFPKQILNT